jgi:GntR family transcriptional regulator, transcriptional repressor for pyruvate dehydrogenase complex
MQTRLPLSVDQHSPPRVRELVARLRQIIFEYPAGTLLGRENELCLRLGCNQGMLRQVARQLEAQGLLYIRRGPNGGYFASRPAENAVLDLAALYLVGVGTTLRDTMMACRGMAIDAARAAAEKYSSSEKSVSMRELLEELGTRIPEDMDSHAFILDEERIDQAIFAVVNIKALRMFINILNRFSLKDFGKTLFGRQPERRRVYREERLRTLEAIIAGDGNAAEASMRRVLNMINTWLPAEALDQPIGRDMVLTDEVAP